MSKVDWSKAPEGAEWWAHSSWWIVDEDGKERSFSSNHGWCLSWLITSSKLADNYEPRPAEWPETDERIDRIGRNRTEDDMGHYNEQRDGHYNRNGDEVFGRSIGIYTTPDAPESTQGDLINKPKHYQLIGDLEAVDVIERTLTPEQFKGYLIGNFLKYRLRAGSKDDALQDLAKSEWYRQRAAK